MTTCTLKDEVQQYYSQPLRFGTDDASVTQLNVSGLQPDTKYKVQVTTYLALFTYTMIVMVYRIIAAMFIVTFTSLYEFFLLIPREPDLENVSFLKKNLLERSVSLVGTSNRG